MYGWEQLALSNFIQFKNGKKRPARTGKVPVYGGNGILDYADTANNENSVIIGRVGAYCGSVYYESSPHWVSDNAISAVNKNNSDIVFDYYLLRSLDLNYRHIGTSQPLLTQEILNSIEVLMPPLSEQVEIGRTLRVLDDKIANNTKINHHLEQMAQAIFKSWFVDFEPWGGVMPDGWREGILGDVASITSGKRPPFRQSTASAEADIPLIGASSIMGFTNAILYNEKILITGRVGTHGVIQRYSRSCWASDNTLVIKSDYYEFAYQQLRGVDFHNMNRGSTQPLITQTDLKNVPIVLPDQATLLEFEELVGSLMKQHEGNICEVERLTEIRDVLLPKLMSGELSAADLDNAKDDLSPIGVTIE